MKLSHSEGFEKEERFRMIWQQAYCDCPVLKARTVKRIIAHVAPEFIDGLFESRPCKRKLRYIGHDRIEDEDFHSDYPDDFFKIGEIYESIEYNGATYTIEGYGDGKVRIGSAYFERVT